MKKTLYITLMLIISLAIGYGIGLGIDYMLGDGLEGLTAKSPWEIC